VTFQRRRPVRLLSTLLLSAASIACTGTVTEIAAAEAPVTRPIRAAFLIVDGVYNTELMAPWDVFEHARHYDPEGRGIEVYTVSPAGGEVVTAEGLTLIADHSFSTAPQPDILVVPSARDSRGGDRHNLELIDWVRSTGSQADQVMSLCWGAFILAEAGLLEGHASTTFPKDYALFAQTFPDLDVRFNVSFVHDRGRLTSQGGARSYEAAMYLVDLLFGEEVARGVGSGLLIRWPMPAESRRVFVTGN